MPRDDDGVQCKLHSSIDLKLKKIDEKKKRGLD